ncbi:interleukin-17 receptor B isoform X2 [Pteropus alecto]|uniref:interleukin-17 receptor B isoform X2 n=1 Tax=Pteropus alecto TaxID=9402 RepID=UPI0007688A62|nr:interleukin-17 receptor B isoform X2 [Pteropus alecto]
MGGDDLAMSLMLLSLAALCWGAVSPEPTIQCGPETGPSPEWMVRHTLTPGDLRDLRVEPVKSSVASEDYSILMNISWILRADASIRLLKATKICVTGKSGFQSYGCVRCNYTEVFQTQSRPSGGKWMFFYIGFPVELNTLYFIGAHNIPNANMNEDSPSMSVNFTSPGCLDHVMKYKKKCIEAVAPTEGLSCLGGNLQVLPSAQLPPVPLTCGHRDPQNLLFGLANIQGSLWDPNITACKKNENMVEVNFTISPLGNRYMVLILKNTVIGTSVSEEKLTRTSVMVPVTGESEGAVVQLTPYFHTCGNDCIRRKGMVVLCPQTGVPFSPDNSKSILSGWLPLLALLVATWVLVLGICLTWRREKIKMSLSSTMLLPITVLVVYPSEICFHHTVCYFAEFLQNHCRSQVILDKWQKKKIAEMGPVQWLTTQKKAADKVIFLLSNDVNTICDGTCGKSEGSPCENSQDLFPLAFNLFCSDLRSQTHQHKYIVVYFREADTKDDYNALNVCPKYCLMKDATSFCMELLHVEQQVSTGKRLRACHNRCSSL